VEENETMKFFQKRSVSVILAILMVLAGLVIGIEKGRKEAQAPTDAPGSAESYAVAAQYLLDESGTLSADAKEWIIQYNADTKRLHQSLVGVLITNGLDGLDLETAADKAFEQMGLSERDGLLLVDLKTQSWYFVYGYELEAYVNSELEACFYDNMDGVLDNPSRGLPILFEDLAEWYRGNMAEGNVVVRVGKAMGAAVSVVFLVALLIIALVVVLIVRVLHAGRRVVRGPRVHFCGPTMHHHTTHFGGFHHTNHRPSGGTGSFRSSGSAGRSSSNRGGFGGSGSRGGFGGKR